jgi:NAD+ kinase
VCSSDLKSALLSPEAEVELTVLDPERRPLRAFVDGQDMSLVKRMSARLSHVAAVELMFDSDHDVAEKIAELQFRHTGLSQVD